MRFSITSLSLLSLVPSVVLGQAWDSDGKTNLTKFSVEPIFPESSSLGAHLVNDKDNSITFKFNNQEDFPVSVAAYEGSFTYKGQDTPYSNLTSTKIDPLLVEANGGQSYTTNLKVTLPPVDFDFALSFLVVYEGGMSTFTVDPVALSVTDTPISIFDPKLIIAIVILVLTVVGGAYFGITAFLFPYLEEQKPVVKKQPVVETEPQTPGVVLNDKGYDESWIPQHHLEKKASRKSKTN